MPTYFDKNNLPSPAKRPRNTEGLRASEPRDRSGRDVTTLKPPPFEPVGRKGLVRAADLVRFVVPTGRAVVLVPAFVPIGPEEMQAAAAALAKDGWFFDPDTPMSDFREAAAALTRGQPQVAEEIMTAHFARREQEIEQRLLDRLPKRAPIVSSGFTAHRRADYALSVLAFLSQADGVCAELRGGHFFLRERHGKGAAKRPRQTAAYAARNSRDKFDQAALSALEIDLPILAQIDARAPGDRCLNRHAVLHGQSADYGTRANSLRGISLLNYVAFGAETRPLKRIAPLQDPADADLGA